MPEFTLTREKTSAQGTFGTLRGPDGKGGELLLYTLELPWRDNQQHISCIPPGFYRCVPHSSPLKADGTPGKYQNVFRLLRVPGREGILIHAGNWAGDTARGLLSDSTGCILPGLTRTRLKNQEAVGQSAAALQVLRAAVNDQPFGLTITSIPEKA